MAKTIISAKKWTHEDVAEIVFAVVSDKEKQPNKNYIELVQHIITNKGETALYEDAKSGRTGITGLEIPKYSLLCNDCSLIDKNSNREQKIPFQDGYGMPFGYEGIAAYIQVSQGFHNIANVIALGGIVGNCKKYCSANRNPKITDEAPAMKYIQDCCEMLAAQMGETLADDDLVYKMNSLAFPFSEIYGYDKQTKLFFDSERIPEYKAPDGYTVIKCTKTVLDPTLIIVNSYYAPQVVYEPHRNTGEYFLCANEFVNWWIENECGEVANPDEYTEWNIDYRKCHEYENPATQTSAEKQTINSFIEYLNAN